jgi:hypothetical protein
VNLGNIEAIDLIRAQRLNKIKKCVIALIRQGNTYITCKATRLEEDFSYLTKTNKFHSRKQQSIFKQPFLSTFATFFLHLVIKYTTYKSTTI